MVDHKFTTIQACIIAAEESKAQGNDYFRTGRLDEALVAYRSALGHLPKRPTTTDAIRTGEDGPSAGETPPDTFTDDLRPSEDLDPLLAEPNEIAKLRAVLNGNIGACYVRLADHQQVVDACSQALDDDPHYVKALQRRAASNETIGSWTSLTAAQEDYSTLLKIFPPSSTQQRDIERSLKSLKPRIEAAQKRETTEMLDKLKGLGNSVLGNFGLSTDNFKFEPNGQGGYSVNFSR